MSTRANLYIDQGIDFSITLDLFDNDGTNFPVVDQQFTCEVRKVFSSNVAFDGVVTVNLSDNNTNNIDLTFSANTTANVEPGKYQYDVIMTTTTQRSKILEGLIFILPTITR